MMQIGARFPQISRAPNNISRVRSNCIEGILWSQELRKDRIGSARRTPLTAHPNLVEAQEHMPARSRLPKIQLRTETRKQQDLVNLLLHRG